MACVCELPDHVRRRPGPIHWSWGGAGVAMTPSPSLWCPPIVIAEAIDGKPPALGNAGALATEGRISTARRRMRLRLRHRVFIAMRLHRHLGVQPKAARPAAPDDVETRPCSLRVLPPAGAACVSSLIVRVATRPVPVPRDAMLWVPSVWSVGLPRGYGCSGAGQPAFPPELDRFSGRPALGTSHCLGAPPPG